MKQIVMILIKAYRYGLSPFLGSHCRYYPSCSSYALTALEQHGLMSGLWLGIRRLARCHPWHEGGFDPVPENVQKSPDPGGHKEIEKCRNQRHDHNH